MSDFLPVPSSAPDNQLAEANFRRIRPSGFEPMDTAQDNPGLAGYLGVIRRQLWVVLGVIAVTVGATLYFVLTAPPRYRATAVVRLADTRRALTGQAEGAAQVLGRETDVLLSQIEVLTSRAVIGEVVDREAARLIPLRTDMQPAQVEIKSIAQNAATDTLTLDFFSDSVVARTARTRVAAPYQAPILIDGIGLFVLSRPAIASAKYRLVSRNEAIDRLTSSVRARPRQQTDIIDIDFTSSNPQEAQRFANAVATAFKDYNTESAQQQSKRRRLFLEEQMRKTDSALRQAQVNYAQYRAGRQVFSSREKATAQQAGIVDIELRRAQLDADRKTYQSLLGQAQRAPGDATLRALVSAPGFATNPVIQQMYRQLSAFEDARDSLVTNGAATTNPDVVNIEARIAATIDRLLTAVQSQIRTLDAQINALDALGAKSSAEISTLPATEAEETQLEQELETIRRMASQLHEEHQKASMAEAVEAGQVEIVNLADLPTLPIAEGKLRKLTFALMMGIILGIGLAVVIDDMNTSIRRRDDVERILHVQNLAVIPRFSRSVRSRRISQTGALIRRNGSSSNASSDVSELVTIYDPHSSEAEAYRTLRTNLIFSRAVQTLRTLVVTSATPGEGKTATAANLAVTFSQQGMRVLLLDCDLRRGRIHQLFKVPRSPGLTDLVSDGADPEQAAQMTIVPGLYVVTSGTARPNPSEILGGERMRSVLASFTGAFDLVVIDSPPLLAASDAAILGRLVDGVAVVLRAGSTDVDAGNQAIQQLTAVGARVIGAVLNDPEAKIERAGAYYRYEYSPAMTDKS